jgi:glycosyltransferase involved in cell wall biosynthesis
VTEVLDASRDTTRSGASPGRRRLLVASLSPGRGGAEEYAKTIAVGAAVAGWRVTFAAPEIEETRSLIAELRRAGVDHIGVPPVVKRRSGHIPAILGFLAVLVRCRPHAVLLGLPWPRFAFGQLLTCALLAVPTLVVFHAVPEHSENLQRELEPRRRMYGWARSRRQTWIGVSDHVRATVAQLFGAPEAELGRIYNGVELGPGMARARRGVDMDTRRKFGLGPDEFVVLAVGRLSPEKAHVDLINAVGRLVDRYPGLRLLIAGDGQERAALEERVVALGTSERIRLLGHVEDPRELYRAADLFVLPSRFEGTPLAMLEAMASGLPVVTTRFGGAEEIIEQGHDGVLVAPGDPSGLAETIERLMDDRAGLTAMGANGRCTAQRFSQASMVDQTLAVLGATAAG